MAKGIIMAGGVSTRLMPMTQAVNKHLLPVYDKPMIYYPLTTLMLAGIRDILVISNGPNLRDGKDISALRAVLGDGMAWGINIEYAVQPGPSGIASGLVIGEKFIGQDRVVLILGDNIFYGAELAHELRRFVNANGAVIFCQQVADPSRYGIVEFNGRWPIGIEEKPEHPKSNWAVTGLYFYDASAVEIAKNITMSARGEFEITDVNRIYLAKNKLFAERLGRGFAWFDAGTPQSLLQASNFIYTLQERQGMRIGDPEEVAATMGWL